LQNSNYILIQLTKPAITQLIFLKEANESDASLSIALVDMDKFDAINKEYA